MNLLGVNLLATLRQRLGGALAVLAASAACCVCGALMAFVFAPGQALQAWRISRMPQMDAAAVQAATPGQAVLFTGVLAGNTPLREGTSLVAYRAEEFVVTVPASDDSEGPSEPSGSWKAVEINVPELTLDMNGQTVLIRIAEIVQLNGALHEEIVPGSGVAADYQGEQVTGGTLRYEGLYEGDLVTVLGQKDSAGGVVPKHLFGGDRAGFEDSQRQAASGLLVSGLCSMALAPVVLVGGLLAVLFGRRR